MDIRQYIPSPLPPPPSKTKGSSITTSISCTLCKDNITVRVFDTFRTIQP